MSNDNVIENVTVEQWINEFKAHTDRWGKLASGNVPREHVRKVIAYLERSGDGTVNQLREEIDRLKTEKEELRNDLTTANRQVAAAKARESKCKKQLKSLKENNDE